MANDNSALCYESGWFELLVAREGSILLLLGLSFSPFSFSLSFSLLHPRSLIIALGEQLYVLLLLDIGR